MNCHACGGRADVIVELRQGSGTTRYGACHAHKPQRGAAERGVCGSMVNRSAIWFALQMMAGRLRKERAS